MRHRSCSLASFPVVFAAVLSCACLVVPLRAAAQGGAGAEPVRTAPSSATPTSDAARVEATLRALFAAAERKDLTALDTLYAGDSLTVIEGTGIDRGWTDYRDHHLAPELKEMRNFRYRPSDMEAHVNGDVAWAIFRYTLRAETSGRAADIVGRGTAILERRGARWVVRHTQTSGRPRRASDPAAN